MNHKDEMNAMAIKAARETAAKLRTLIWDGTGLTLEEFLEDPGSARWRDTGMTTDEFLRFVRED